MLDVGLGFAACIADLLGRVLRAWTKVLGSVGFMVSKCSWVEAPPDMMQ